MKTVFQTLLSATLLLQGFSSAGQPKVSVPAPVQAAFAKAYPAARDIKWEKDHKDYEVAFLAGESSLELKYNAQGTLLEKEEKVSAEALPQVVRATLEKDFSEYTVKNAELVERLGVKTYEVVVQKGKSEYELTLDASGKLLKKEKE